MRNMPVQIESDVFNCLRLDFNFMVEKLIKNILNKGQEEGDITIKVNVRLNEVPDINENLVTSPMISHKISSTLKITESKDGFFGGKNELYWDEYDQIYKVKPIDDGQGSLDFD